MQNDQKLFDDVCLLVSMETKTSKSSMICWVNEEMADKTNLGTEVFAPVDGWAEELRSFLCSP